MLIDMSPLRKYRDFRLLYAGQMVSYLGSMVSYVAVPYQVYELTKSSFVVGLLGSAQLLPVLIFGLIGGSVADAMDRRKLLIYSELVMSLCALALCINSMSDTPSVTLIFIATAIMQAANGFHRPAMDAMNQKLVERSDYGAVSALGSLRSSVGAILGPALGGVLIAGFGAKTAYFFDFISFGVAMILLMFMRQMPKSDSPSTASLESIREGLRYAMRRPELMGTYIVDIVAMTFAFPTALFPAMSESWGGAKAAGALFSAMALGALIVTLFSGWTPKVKRHGAVVVLAAGSWGLAIVGFGMAQSLIWAVFFLALAGAADMISGIFRGIIWNETIPNNMRGRLSGIEMISYMSGPLIGNTRAGWMAASTSNSTSVISGGVICVVAVVACAFLLPRFWNYRSVTPS
jgi:MFS family permease